MCKNRIKSTTQTNNFTYSKPGLIKLPMSDVVLKVENLSKQYRLGLVGSRTIQDDVKRWWYKTRGKEDPFLEIGAVNDRSAEAESDYIWALRDINFEVKQGEVLGIIGKNGAGKSTLLKILSKVTGPTTGTVKAKGRIASLLEVGTGFHPELTGRENIFLNGAILGMTKPEIRAKLDEIIDFAGVAKYVDTPVKRYSSGMKVRLGFAVAAHLEPEILIVDEVLAVGDAEFQKKAIGKMQDVSRGEGRTVLFVSHNMASIKKLCSNVQLLSDGKVSFNGNTNLAIDYYLKQTLKENSHFENKLPQKNKLYGLTISEVTLVENQNQHIEIEVEVVSQIINKNIGFGIRIKDDLGNVIGSVTPALTAKSIDLEIGKGRVKILVNNVLDIISGGDYYIDLWVSKPKLEVILYLENVLKISIKEIDLYNTGKLYEKEKHGIIKLTGECDLISKI
jgi:homopolymeric O-antigen transport system ATP-binding protein